MKTVDSQFNNFQTFPDVNTQKQREKSTNTGIIALSVTSAVVYGNYLYNHPDSKIYAYRKLADLLKYRGEGLSLTDLYNNSSSKSKLGLKMINENGSKLFKALKLFTDSSGRLKMVKELKQIYNKPENLLLNELRNKSSVPELIEKIFKNFENECPVPEMSAKAIYAAKKAKEVSTRINSEMKKMAIGKGVIAGFSIFSLLLLMKHAIKIWSDKDEKKQ